MKIKQNSNLPYPILTNAKTNKDSSLLHQRLTKVFTLELIQFEADSSVISPSNYWLRLWIIFHRRCRRKLTDSVIGRARQKKEFQIVPTKQYLATINSWHAAVAGPHQPIREHRTNDREHDGVSSYPRHKGNFHSLILHCSTNTRSRSSREL